MNAPTTATIGGSTSTPTDESRLVVAVLRGDQRAARELYDRHIAAVLSIAHRALGDADLAEECAQEVFLRAFRSLHRFRGTARLGTWLHRIAVRTAVDLRRGSERPIRRGAVELEEADAVDRPAAGDPLLREKVVRAVDELPPSQRDVAILYYFRSLTHEEIAAALGIPVGTSRRRLHDARRSLAPVLRPLVDRGGR